MEKLSFSLYTAEAQLAHEIPVKEVIVPSHRGELGILPGHASLISLLEAGIIKYWKESSSEPEKVAVGWGYLEISEGKIRVLADTAQTKLALDQKKIEEDLRIALSKQKEMEFDFEKRQDLEKEIKRLTALKDLIS